MNIQLLLVATLFSLLRLTVLAQDTPIGSATKLPNHPRILWLAGEEARIRQAVAADKTWSSVH